MFQLSYAKKSVLAGAWYIAAQSPLSHGLCLCGEGRVEEGVVRQWVEYYMSKIRTETRWDTLNRDQLLTILKVCFILVCS